MKKFLLSPLFGLLIVSGFAITPANAGAPWGFQLRNYQTGLCLVGATGVRGTNLETWYCNSIASVENWGQVRVGSPYVYSFNFASNGDFYLEPLNYPNSASSADHWSGLVIGVQAAVMANGTPLILWSNTYESNQQWSSVYMGNDLGGHPCYILENQGPTGAGQPYVMGVAGGYPNAGTQIILWRLLVDQYGNPDYYGHPDQYWCVY